MTQAAEIQKIPQDFNDRVARIKERTAEITKKAASQSRSKSKDKNKSQPVNIFIQENQYQHKDLLE